MIWHNRVRCWGTLQTPISTVDMLQHNTRISIAYPVLESDVSPGGDKALGANVSMMKIWCLVSWNFEWAQLGCAQYNAANRSVFDVGHQRVWRHSVLENFTSCDEGWNTISIHNWVVQMRSFRLHHRQKRWEICPSATSSLGQEHLPEKEHPSCPLLEGEGAGERKASPG